MIERHQPSSDPAIPPFGLGFIFFSVCAGKVKLAPAWQNIDFATQLNNATLGFPLDCIADDGTQLGPDDFVAGYTQQFVYAGTENVNPVIDNGVSFAGDTPDRAAYCIGDECVPPNTLASIPANLPDPKLCSAAGNPYPHRPACSGKCPTYDFQPSFLVTPTFDRANQVDEFASAISANNGASQAVEKQMWINYYTDSGSLKHPVRLLRDATTGWNSKFFTTWTPPAEPGPVNLWAAVHDTRGGVEWTRLIVCVD